jgi:hypothetical protein
VNLVRIRWQEAWGVQLQGVLDDAYTPDEAASVIRGLAADWFPNGFELTPDADSPNVWKAVATDGRTLWFFVEPVGG